MLIQSAHPTTGACHQAPNTDTSFVPSALPPATTAYDAPATSQRRALPMLAMPLPPSPTVASTTATPAPTWFKVGFESLDIDAAQIKDILAQGRPFAADVDGKLTAILGAPFRAGGVEALFTRAWPSAVWVASYEEVDDEFDMPRFTLSALDRLGKVIFDVSIGFMRCIDGAIDMHAAGADVDRDHRGFGITAYAELLREKILQAYARHPQSRLSLQASNAVNANTGAKQPPSGFYLHALRGYMLSDSQDVPSLPYPRNTPDGEADQALSQLALLAKYFKRWAQKQYPQLTDAMCTALTSGCAQPYDYAQMTCAGQPIGKAYLVSGDAPAWYGVHFVHPPQETSTTERIGQERRQSQGIWEHRMADEIAAAQQRRLGLQQSLWQQANSSDGATRAAAYACIGAHGHPTLITFLQGRLAQESAPRVQASLQESIAHIRGERVDFGLRQAAQDPQRPEVVREEMRQRLLARGASEA